MARVVFDTVVFVRTLLNRRSHWAKLVFEHADDYRLVISPPVVREVLEVLSRPKLARRFTRFSGRDPSALLGILSTAEVVEIDLNAFPLVCRDRNDDKFLATAQVAGAEYLVSEDLDLLVLGKYEGTAIVDATTFLDILGQGRHEAR